MRKLSFQIISFLNVGLIATSQTISTHDEWTLTGSNKSVTCEITISEINRENFIEICSKLIWETPNHVPFTTNINHDSPHQSNSHIHCAIEEINEPDNGIILLNLKQTLYIKSINFEHNGQYTCKHKSHIMKTIDIKVKENPSRTCQNSNQCISGICYNHQCKCHSVNHNYLPDRSQCVQRKKLDESCHYDEECHNNRDQFKARWTQYWQILVQPNCRNKCRCPGESVEHRLNTTNFCFKKVSHGESCNSNAECQTFSEHLYCKADFEKNRTNTCECNEGFHWIQDKCQSVDISEHSDNFTEHSDDNKQLKRISVVIVGTIALALITIFLKYRYKKYQSKNNREQEDINSDQNCTELKDVSEQNKYTDSSAPPCTSKSRLLIPDQAKLSNSEPRCHSETK